MGAKQQVLPLVQAAVQCAIQDADAYQMRITQLAEMAKSVAELKLALKNDPSGLPVIPLTVAARVGATAYSALAKVASASALAPFL